MIKCDPVWGVRGHAPTRIVLRGRAAPLNPLKSSPAAHLCHGINLPTIEWTIEAGQCLHQSGVALHRRYQNTLTLVCKHIHCTHQSTQTHFNELASRHSTPTQPHTSHTHSCTQGTHSQVHGCTAGAWSVD